jgi:hypothetical protein
MSANMRPRTQGHWSVRLRIKRPGSTSRVVLIGLALLQALLLYLTASSFASGGGLYGCSTPCGSVAAPTAPPFAAVLISVAVLLLPAVIGALCNTWQEAVMLAALPWLVAVVFTASTLLAPAYGVVAATRLAPAASHFGPPFWLDAGRLLPLLLSLGFFAMLGWLGWVTHEAVFDT